MFGTAIKTRLGPSVPHTREPCLSPSNSASVQLPADVPLRSKNDGSLTWVPATNMGDHTEFHVAGPALDVMSIWGMTWGVEDLYLCL